jgi:biotin carboxyl carrier protein
MDYEIEIGNVSRKIRLERSFVTEINHPVEKYRVETISDNSEKTAEVAKSMIVIKREADRILLSIEDKMYWVTQNYRSSSSVDFLINGNQTKASLLVEGHKRSGGGVSSGVATVNEIVVSNFPAKVIAVRASVGSSVEEGETLIILEAMKMEAQLKAPKKCIVKDIFVKEGDLVARGARLAQLIFD